MCIRDSHYYIQRTVGEEEFEHLIRKIRQGGHTTETKECYGIATVSYTHLVANASGISPRMVEALATGEGCNQRIAMGLSLIHIWWRRPRNVPNYGFLQHGE